MASDVCSGTRIICFNLWIALSIFYLVIYMFASVLSGAFKIKSFDGKIPFDFINCCSQDNKSLVNMLSLVLTYMTCTGVFLIFIRKRIWDYAVTISLIHLGITCAVMQDFPVNWQWWLAYGSSVLFMITFGEIAIHWCCKDKAQQTSTVSTTNLIT